MIQGPPLIQGAEEKNTTHRPPPLPLDDQAAGGELPRWALGGADVLAQRLGSEGSSLVGGDVPEQRNVAGGRGRGLLFV